MEYRERNEGHLIGATEYVDFMSLGYGEIPLFAVGVSKNGRWEMN